MDKRAKKPIQIVTENGEPSAVIIGIDEYTEMLERLEDLDDLETLAEMRKKPLNFRSLEEFLEEHSSRV